MMLLLHVGEAIAPHDLWRACSAPPLETSLLMVTGAWYAIGVRTVWARAGTGRGITRRRALGFAAGMLMLGLALLSPLDVVADALFSAHMTQHLLLILVAAPLLVSGAPMLAMIAALPRGAAREAGRWWIRRRVLRSVAHRVTSPGVVFALHLAALWFWHLPGPYAGALAVPALHALEHVSFLATAALLWWVIAPSHGRPRASDGEAIAMVVGTLMHGGVLGALITLADHPWYAAHISAAGRFGMRALEDQQLAGLIMWVPSAAVYAVTGAVLFLRWFRADERRLSRDGARLVPTFSNGAAK